MSMYECNGKDQRPQRDGTTGVLKLSGGFFQTGSQQKGTQVKGLEQTLNWWIHGNPSLIAKEVAVVGNHGLSMNCVPRLDATTSVMQTLSGVVTSAQKLMDAGMTKTAHALQPLAKATHRRRHNWNPLHLNCPWLMTRHTMVHVSPHPVR